MTLVKAIRVGVGLYKKLEEVEISHTVILPPNSWGCSLPLQSFDREENTLYDLFEIRNARTQKNYSSYAL